MKVPIQKQSATPKALNLSVETNENVAGALAALRGRETQHSTEGGNLVEPIHD